MKYTVYYAQAKLKAASKRKKIAGKHGYSSIEYCEMEPLKKEHLVTRRKENRQIGV